MRRPQFLLLADEGSFRTDVYGIKPFELFDSREIEAEQGNERKHPTDRPYKIQEGKVGTKREYEIYPYESDRTHKY